MRQIKLIGWGSALPKNTVVFDDQTRYRLGTGQTLLDLAETAVYNALSSAGMTMDDIDCIVSAMATPLQAIPCNAALVHERCARHRDIPAVDINTTCTSFVSALDLLSYPIACGRYGNVLIVSGDTASAALNPAQKESFELFSDAACAFIVANAQEGESSGILYSAQKTWSTGAHDTEIRGGCGLLPVFQFCEDNKAAYYFDMKGSKILRLCIRVLPDFINECLTNASVKRKDIHIVIPHQASRALSLIMPKLGFAKGSYADYVSAYGNMVSASIPFALCKAIEERKISRGDLVLLLGTAAGLTANFLLLQF